ncbi:hypothetical protein WJ97_11955 [Burkholderia ubonensis]|uniref:hypothetical protein n=1 Tax=Burkholderia ubonensis TaxID=101571 RepID=UPI00075259E1|nr:hypothetical protein [Burkholderia ubonensis]KVP96592.1 hypothetical protein WJ97_11955 [Burkholderia ubonensis]
MSQLTSKVANEAAAMERTQAFNARRRVYQEEHEAAEKAADQLPEQVELEAARAAVDAATEERTQALAAIDEQIAHLQAQRVAVDEQHRVVLEGVRQRRDAAWSARATAGWKLKAEVNERYPDMVNCWHPSLWKRPEGV